MPSERQNWSPTRSRARRPLQEEEDIRGSSIRADVNREVSPREPGTLSLSSGKSVLLVSDSRAFWLYWVSTTLSYLGDGVRFVALPLLAVSLSSSPGHVAAVSVASGLPWLLFGLISGVVADRFDRGRQLALVQALRAGVGVVLAVLVLADQVTLLVLIVLAFLLNSGEVFYDVALHSFLPALLPQSRLQWANGRLVTAEVVVFEFIGPAIGGLLFAAASHLPFFFDVATFFVSAVIFRRLARLRPTRTSNTADVMPKQSVHRDLLEGFSWWWTSDVVRSLTLVATAVNFGAGGLYALLALYSQNDLNLAPTSYGFMLAVGAVGSTFAGLCTGKLTAPALRRWTVIFAGPSASTSLAALAMSNSPLFVFACLAVFGFFVTVFNVVAVSLRQALTPNSLMGRVTSVHRVFCWGALPLGALYAGIAGELFSTRTGIVSAGLTAGFLCVFALPRLLHAAVSAFTMEEQPTSGCGD